MTDVLNKLMLSCIKLKLPSALGVSGLLTPQREPQPVCPGRRRVAIVNKLFCLQEWKVGGKELRAVIFLLRFLVTHQKAL